MIKRIGFCPGNGVQVIWQYEMHCAKHIAATLNIIGFTRVDKVRGERGLMQFTYRLQSHLDGQSANCMTTIFDESAHNTFYIINPDHFADDYALDLHVTRSLITAKLKCLVTQREWAIEIEPVMGLHYWRHYVTMNHKPQSTSNNP